MWRCRPSVLRAALWALTQVRHVRRQLAAGVMRPTLKDPPILPSSAIIGVLAVLTRFSPTCLEGALVRQHWMAHHGDRRDVVIGLPQSDFGATPAHAWVDGTDDASARRYIELHRLAPQLDGLESDEAAPDRT